MVGVDPSFTLGQMAANRERILRALAKDGLLISASCSFHLVPRELNDLLLQQARHLDRNLQILERGHQGPDHPIHPAIPETDYIKCLFARVLPG